MFAKVCAKNRRASDDYEDTFKKWMVWAAPHTSKRHAEIPKQEIQTVGNLRPRKMRDYVPHYGHQHLTEGKVSINREAAGQRGDANGTNAEPTSDAHADGNIHATHGNDHGDSDFEIEADAAEEAALVFLFTLVSMKRGLKLFGERGEEAVEAELRQVHDRNVMMAEPHQPQQRHRRR